MTSTLEFWRDAAIGETRELLVRNGTPVALRVVRWSEERRRARWGEVYDGRIASVDRRRRGAFINLGLGEQSGFLPLNAAGQAVFGNRRVPLNEGQRLAVRVVREGARGKSPVVDYAGDAQTDRLGRTAQPECDEELAAATSADSYCRQRIDEVLELALSSQAPLKGGGRLIVQPTAAVVAVDVDAGARQGSSDAERFALDVNLAAAEEVARQVRLRSLGGLIAIDFVSMRLRSNQKALEDAVRVAFADDPWRVQFGGLSRFGLYQLARAQLRTPLHEVMCDDNGDLSSESLALVALRAIEREATAHGGRQITCTVSAATKSWLDAHAIEWARALTERIGPRWRIEVGDGPRDMIDARPT